MNKLLLILSALTIVMIGTIVSANCGPTFDLIAGGGNPKSAIDAGDVDVWYDCTHLYVKYTTTPGWCITETHLHVAGDEADIPQTKKGNPIPGHFSYSTDHDPCETEVVYTIPRDGLSGNVYIAAHAVVCEATYENCVPICTCDCETAWGEGTEFANDRGWAMYIPYTIG